MKKFFLLKGYLVAIFSILSAILLYWVFANNMEDSFLSYIIYTFSFYSLTTLVLFLSLRVKKIRLQIITLLKKNNKTRAILDDRVERYRTFLFVSFVLNLTLSIIKIAIGVYLSSYWVLINGAYYMILAILRAFISTSWKESAEKQRAKIKIAGFLLAIMAITYFVILIEMYINYSAITYPMYLIYLAALYAFVKVSFAIKDIFSKKIERSPVIVATFCVKLANALVAIIFLESSMLAEFGSNSEGERVLLLISGCSVALIILLLSVYISKHAGKYHS